MNVWLDSDDLINIYSRLIPISVYLNKVIRLKQFIRSNASMSKYTSMAMRNEISEHNLYVTTLFSFIDVRPSIFSNYIFYTTCVIIKK